jgi:hypothetical protein
VLAPVADERIRTNLVQPGSVVCVGCEPVECPKRLEQGLLVEIVGIGSVASELTCKPVYLVAEPFPEFSTGSEVRLVIGTDVSCDGSSIGRAISLTNVLPSLDAAPLLA